MNVWMWAAIRRNELTTQNMPRRLRRSGGRRCDLGMLFCGTGVGMSIAANKVKGIRCVVCVNPILPQMARQHNNANILALGFRVVGIELTKMIVDAWLNAEV